MIEFSNSLTDIGSDNERLAWVKPINGCTIYKVPDNQTMAILKQRERIVRGFRAGMK